MTQKNPNPAAKPVFKRARKDDGFSLVEIMVAMFIIGLTATFVVINLIPRQTEAKINKARADVRMIEQALELYRLDNGRYPTPQEGLDVLTGDGSNSARSVYIKFLPDDPWGNAYVYIIPGENGEFDLLSYGADGTEGGEDYDADIVNWKP